MFLLRDTTHRMLLQYHPTLGHLYVPNQRARVPNENGGYFVTTNADGFRSDIEFRREKGVRPRLLFFGDSYTAGDNCENAQRFSELVAGAFGAEAYNYGVSGSGIDQTLLTFETFAREVQADLVVLCVQTDAIRRIQQRERESFDRTTRKRVLVPKPYFTLENGELRLHQVPVPRVRPEAHRTAPGLEAEGFLGNVLEQYRANENLAPLRRVVRTKLPRWQSRAYKMLGAQPYPDYLSEETAGWRLLEEIINRFIERVAPTPLLIVPVPGYHYFLHGAEPVYQKLFHRFENSAQRVYVADVTTPMQAMPWERRRQLCFQHDSHFSSAGHETVARLLTARIEECGLLAKSKSPSGAAARSGANGQFILGVSCFYHDSAACLIRDGELVAAAQEERFSRIKADKRFPRQAINYCLEEAGIHPADLAAIVYHENASLAFERIMRSQVAAGDAGGELFSRAVPSWLRFKLKWPAVFRRHLRYDGLLLQDDHHRSHAASAFFPSPFERAAILTIDGVGEWATATIGVGHGAEIRLLKEMRFPNSLGLLYSAFTQFTGFEVNEGEYKMMGLAPYGQPKYVDLILSELIDLKDDGSLSLKTKYFGFLTAESMVNEQFARLFGGPARSKDKPISRREMDIARSIQEVTEEAMLRMARHAHALTGERNLCLAGGVALNCVANGRILREGPFERLWIQPAAGDAGAALGAALDAHHTYFGAARRISSSISMQGGSLLGPSFADDEIKAFLDTHGYPYEQLPAAEQADRVASLLEQGKVVGFSSGRMEFGPRALGARSILGDPRNPETQVTLNLRIKYRESFRPFAPAVLEEKCADYFDLDQPSPYMLIVAPVRQGRRKPPPPIDTEDLLTLVRQERSDIPAITHVDYSARIQTVSPETNEPFSRVIKAFEDRTGTAVVVNTSFNVRGEPIICTPYDAYRCFMRTEMDFLVIGSFLLAKAPQPAWPESKADRDREKKPSSVADPLTGKLKAFHRKFVAPLAHRFDERTALGADSASTLWHDIVLEENARSRFQIPPVLDAANVSTDELATAVMSTWQRDAVTNALESVMASLLRYCQERSEEPEETEEISDSMYVMF